MAAINRSVLFEQLFGVDSDLSGDEYTNNGDGQAENINNGDSEEDEDVEVENTNNGGEEDENTIENGEAESTLGNGEADSSSGPQIGMLYTTLDSLFEDYQAFAKRNGFSVMKRSFRKIGSVNGIDLEREVKYALFVCCKAGKRSPTSTLSKKTDCKARLNAKKMVDGSWVVSSIFNEHNHEIDPAYSVLMPAHRHLSVHMKRQLEAIDRAGIRPSKNIRFLEVQNGGPENLGCLRKDCQNYIEERQRMRIGNGDAEAVRSLFDRLKVRDGNFYHLLDVDDEGRLRNVLWIHPRSRAAYEEFNDAVSFDTTYLVNRHQMRFASVVGVNHHGHSILLGCALVTQENTESFKWLFSNWLAAMGGVAPVGIITDQDDSIKLALQDIMPETIHRYCIWHIMAKLPVKFRGVADYNKVINEWKGVVYDSLDIASFEMNWAAFIAAHGLEGHRWLRDLYSEREKWVPVYLNHTFWAGMISTQRSEGMHAYFDEYLHSRCTLTQFMEQYEMAIGKKIQKEFHVDFESKNKMRRCSTEYKWEAQFQEVYTNSIFKRVQDNIERMKYYFVQPDQESHQAGIERYSVMETKIINNFYRRDYTYVVEYRRNGEYLECNCRNFEFKGLLCCHIFEVMRTLHLKSVNERYILRRWRKDVVRRCSSIFFSGGYPHMTDEYKRYQELEKFFLVTADLVIGDGEKTEFAKSTIDAMNKSIENWGRGPANNADEQRSSQVSRRRSSQANENTPILNPQITKTKGRPNEKRIRSCLERGGRRGRGRTTTVTGRGRGSRGATS